MRISVVLHASDTRAHEVEYVLWPMCERWREAGHVVDVRAGPPERLDADVIFLHVDLTRTPDEYLAAVADHPRVINRRAVDISKTVVSGARLSGPGDPWQGPVIVKTNRNHGGKPERALEPRGVAGALRDALARKGWLPLRHADALDPYAYPIFPSRAALPSGVFGNPALVVERFLPERRGEHYCLRSYSFLGDRAINELYWGPHPVVKRRDALGWEEPPAPPELEALRLKLGFDYGKFDYVLHDGHPVLLDANRSPAFGHAPEKLARQGEILAPGLEVYARG